MGILNRDAIPGIIMAELIGCLFIIDTAATAFLLWEMHVADLGPTYDENYEPL